MLLDVGALLDDCATHCRHRRHSPYRSVLMLLDATVKNCIDFLALATIKAMLFTTFNGLRKRVVDAPNSTSLSS